VISVVNKIILMDEIIIKINIINLLV